MLQLKSSFGARTLWVGGIAALYAALAMLMATMAAGGASAAPTETVLYAFKGGSDGWSPYASLIADGSGNLFGTTTAGGANGSGVVFSLSPDGAYRVLYSFCSKQGCSDGAVPFDLGGLTADRSGNLYGTTYAGPALDAVDLLNHGTVFKLSPGGDYTVLHSFCGKLDCSDGGGPQAGLIADSAGNLYGPAGGGVAGSTCGACGVVYKLSPDGTYTVLHSFTGSDGAFPIRGLTADGNGNLYGIAGVGGIGCEGGCGVVFKLSPDGSFTVLHTFTGGSDGAGPQGLIIDKSGNIYGTASGGGAFGNGAVFKLSPDGTETVLYSFRGGSDGAGPVGRLLVDNAGNLFGATVRGGIPGCFDEGCGTVFKLSPDGTETVLYSFCSLPNCSDGAGPFDGLIADGNGNLYGTTTGGGKTGCFDHSCGTVFKLTGTGFVTGIPFSFFSSKLVISGHWAYFQLLSNVTLGAGAAYLDPPDEPGTVQVGAYSATIPPGSFVKAGSGEWDFDGTVGGVNIHARIWLTGTKQYLVLMKAMTALTGTKNPVPVTLTLGPNTGTASVTAAIYP